MFHISQNRREKKGPGLEIRRLGLPFEEWKLCSWACCHDCNTHTDVLQPLIPHGRDTKQIDLPCCCLVPWKLNKEGAKELAVRSLI